MKVSSVGEMRHLDQTATGQFAITEEILMENAGLAAFNVLSRKIGIKDKCFVIICGAGNNGGDGMVIARKIHSAGGTPQVFILSDPALYKGAARTNFEIISRLPLEVRVMASTGEIRDALCRCDGVVDAVFGTGLARDVSGRYREVIQIINRTGRPVLSLDIPSGVHGDTGQIMGTAVKADYTVAFGLPKIGNLVFPGCELGGQLFVSHISFPRTLFTDDAIETSINYPPVLPPRKRNGHKNSFGDVLFIAGAFGYFGAPGFAALSFLRSGGGYSRLAAPRSVISVIAARTGEIVFVPQQETPSGTIALVNRDALAELARKTDMTVMGPGLSLEPETLQLVRELARDIEKPLVVDGDGIAALCSDPDIIRNRKAPTVLTPHPGEMSRLTGLGVTHIETDRVGVVRRAAMNLKAVIVLKGARSLIGCPDGRVFINMSGNSGMGTAGSGDVLAGTIAAMFGLGLNVEDAVRKGVFIHGLAGDMAAGDRGEDGVTAQDILDYLPLAMKTDRTGLDKNMDDRYRIPVI